MILSPATTLLIPLLSGSVSGGQGLGAATLELLLVALPAIIGAFGTIISVVVAGRLKRVEAATNGRMERLEAELAEARRERDDASGGYMM